MARITRFEERLKFVIALLADAVRKRHDLSMHAYMDPAIARKADKQLQELIEEVWNMSRPSAQ